MPETPTQNPTEPALDPVIAASFARRQRGFTFLLLLNVAVICAISAGILRPPAMQIVTLSSLALMGTAFVFWRCPKCTSYLWGQFTVRFCPKCGVRLRA